MTDIAKTEKRKKHPAEMGYLELIEAGYRVFKRGFNYKEPSRKYNIQELKVTNLNNGKKVEYHWEVYDKYFDSWEMECSLQKLMKDNKNVEG